MTDKQAVLCSVDVFSDFPAEFVGRCAEAATLQEFGPGETIVKQGDDAESFYVVTRGMADVIAEQPGIGPVVVANLGPGRFFGEMALLQHGHRTATVRAREATECLVLCKSDFDAELRRDPNTAAVLATRLARRINMLNRAASANQA